MKKIGILYHPMKEMAHNLAQKLSAFLTDRAVSVWICSAWETQKARAELDGTGLILSIGGDGTILRAAQMVIPKPIPVTGINLGRLGFLTELSADEAIDKLPELLAGKGWVDERAMLEVELSPEEKPPRVFQALNDVVIARGSIARMVHIDAVINDERLTTYRADGVILATATGSTGYALAASGPILHPQSEDFVLVPIMPHLGLAYPLVLPPTTVVKLQVHTDHEATLSIDGYVNLLLSDGATVLLRHSAHTTRFLRIHPDYYYGSLERKLKGKAE